MTSSIKSSGATVFTQALDGSWVPVGKTSDGDIVLKWTPNSEQTTDEIIEDLKKIEQDLR